MAKANHWKTWSEKVAELSLRERVILATTLFVLVFFLWLQFVFWPIEDKNKRNEQAINSGNTEIAEQAQRLAELEAQLANNPNTPLREEQDRLQAEMSRMKQDIEERLDILVPPEQMADLMRSVLNDYKGLKLLSAKNLDVEPIRIGGGAKTSDDKERDEDSSSQAVFYSHGFEMTLSGSYFQAYEFLTKLEEIDGFFWTRFHYVVDKYPKATIVIQVNTLSLEEDWIGV